MSGLWTPDGERPPPPASEATSANEPVHQRTEDDAAMIAELEQAERNLLAADVADVIANHCYGLFQLAALHLGQQPPRLEESRLAIDALAAIVEGLGVRLGQSAETLRDGLAQIRLAYVEIAGAAGKTNGTASIADDAPSAPS